MSRKNTSEEVAPRFLDFDDCVAQTMKGKKMSKDKASGYCAAIFFKKK